MTRHCLLAALLLASAAPCLAQPPAAASTKRTLQVVAPKFELDEPKNAAHLWGGVTLTTAEGTMTARDMVVTYGKSFSEVVSVLATGDVKLKADYKGTDQVRRLINASSNRGSYDAAARKVTLSGNVRGKLVEPDRNRSVDLDSAEATILLRENRILLSEVKLVFEEVEPQPPAPATPEVPPSPAAP